MCAGTSMRAAPPSWAAAMVPRAVVRVVNSSRADRVSPTELLRHAERWRPWRAYAALLLWNSLPGSGG